MSKKISELSSSKRRELKTSVGFEAFKDFPFEQRHSIPQRAANALHWLAQRQPGVFVMWNVLYRVIVLLGRTPPEKANEVQTLQHSQSLRKWLKNTHNAYLLPVAGVGVRASYNDTDKVTRVLPRAVRRFKSAEINLGEINKSIDLTKVARTPETIPFIGMSRDVRAIGDFVGRYPRLTSVPATLNKNAAPAQQK